MRRWLGRAYTQLPWLLMAGGIAYVVYARLGQRQASLDEGALAPPFTTMLANGEIFSVEAERGKVFVLNFWASWCPPCRAEAPALSRMARRLKAKGAQVISLSTEERSLAEVAYLANQLGMNYPVGVATPQVLEAYGVQALPTTYVIDAEGRIQGSFVGAVDEATLARLID